MTRAGDEKRLRDCFLENLHFLVFDELHTYRGMQGSDVSFLIRRIKSQSLGHVLCFGTSATMVADDTMTYAQQREKVAEVASCIFGSNYTKEQVIDETLNIGLNEDEPSEGELRNVINSPIPESENIEDIQNYPTTIWIEQNIAKKLSNQVDIDFAKCYQHIIDVLNWCNNLNVNHKANILPYKIHQFIPQTGNVYVTIGNSESRIITVDEKLYCEELSHGDTKVMYY